MYDDSVAEGDSGEDDDEADGDIILENDCLTSFGSRPTSGGNDTNSNRNSAAVSLLSQSVSLPNSMAATLQGAQVTPSQNGNSTFVSSRQGNRKDTNIFTL